MVSPTSTVPDLVGQHAAPIASGNLRTAGIPLSPDGYSPAQEVFGLITGIPLASGGERDVTEK